MRYMIIEKFKGGDARRVYRRYFEKGRMAPDGLIYVESWVNLEMGTCFQIMECEDMRLMHEWMKHWRDIVDFEIIPVVTSEEAQKKIREMESL